MMPSKNSVIIAAAGSGKTTVLVEEALRSTGKTLLTTYTIENTATLKRYVYARAGLLPAQLQISTWLSFLLSDGVRPYQNFMNNRARVESIDFVGKPSRYSKREGDDTYFLNRRGWIYSDRVSDFACLCNANSSGALVRRLEGIYENILIDEIQDMAGYDVEFLRLLFASKIQVTVAGDPRQATYFTNCSPKNRKYKGQSIVRLFQDWQNEGICSVSEMVTTHRCNQEICDFADQLNPSLPKTRSVSGEAQVHTGVFAVHEKDVLDYVRLYAPAVLRWDSREAAMGLPASNYGAVKGLEFERVLIFPTKPIQAFLADPTSELKDVARAKLYVAMTRARHSVAFVYDGSIGHTTLQRP